MKNIKFIIFVALAWSFSLINTSGLGIAYNTPTKTNIFILIWCLFIFIRKKGKGSNVIEKNLILLFCSVLSFIIIPFLTAHSWEGLSYLMMVPLVYCFSQQTITDKAMILSGYAVAGLGLFVLVVYDRTEILSGWNDNHISMIGLFSYIYYSISLYGKLTGRKLTIGLLISVLYAMMMSVTNSRSAIIFIVFALSLAYSGNWFRNIIAKKRFVFYALNTPFIISLVFIYFSDFFIFQYFDEWSMNNYGKSGFNGRDEIWIDAYNRLLETNLLGEGKFVINHHNSAVAVLSVFGVLGYICWYKMFAKPIGFMRRFINDNLIFGFISSFLLIFWQQSFELGFVNASPNMIPYMILGLGIARARDLNLRLQKYQESITSQQVSAPLGNS